MHDVLTYREHAVLCIKVGLLSGGGLALLAILLKSVTGLEWSDQEGVTTTGVVGAYLLGGLASGAIVGVLLPVARQLVGAIVVGYLAAVPAFFLLAKTFSPAHKPQYVLEGTLVCSAMGAIIGASIWWEEVGKRRRR